MICQCSSCWWDDLRWNVNAALLRGCWLEKCCFIHSLAHQYLLREEGGHKGMMHGWSLFNVFLLRFDKKRLLCRLAFLATSDENRIATWMLFTKPGYKITSADLLFVSVAVVGGMILDGTWMLLCCVNVGWRNVALFTASHINIYWKQVGPTKG